MMKILIADKLDPHSLSVLEGTEFEVLDRAGISSEELPQALQGCAALVVRSRTQVTDALLESVPSLRAVGRAGTGVDNIDLSSATRRGVIVMNTPGGNSNSAAEHAVAMMMSLARNIPVADQALSAGSFDKGRFLGVELHGKTLGILGLGRIGLLVAEKGKGLGMKVHGFDPVTPPETIRKHGIEPLSMEEVLRSADFVTIHVPLLPETKHLLNEDSLSWMKPQARLINCARGGIVDEAALLTALNEGRLAGAALDVFEVEPPVDSPLLQHPQVVTTPHLGASTEEAQSNVATAILNQIADHLSGRATQGAVNGFPMDAQAREIIGPFLPLALRLGRLAAGLGCHGSRLSARFFGSVTEVSVRPLIAWFLKGYLERFLGSAVNEINALELAAQRGIEVEEVLREEHKSFQTLLSFGFDQTAVAGTLFGRNNLRIVRMLGHNMDAIPEGQLLVITNNDEPGVVGDVGRVLGEERINIGNLSLGRSKEGDRAMAVFNLDAAPSKKTLDALTELSAVHQCTLVDMEDIRNS